MFIKRIYFRTRPAFNIAYFLSYLNKTIKSKYKYAITYKDQLLLN
jgi:hypothetical protein